MAETTTSTYTIRHATESDVPSILAMVKELADYEKALHEVQATPEKLLSTLTFPSDPTKGYAKTLLIFSSPNPDAAGSNSTSASGSAEPAGMALYFNNYSTWQAAPGIYLEDLFVRPESRGKGFGKALLQALARECLATGCARLDWSVLKWNKPSIDFYESDAVGAGMMNEWVTMRVHKEGLEKLAGGK